MIHNINNFQEKNNINLKYDDILIKNIKDDFDKKTNSLTHLNKKENKNRQNKPKNSNKIQFIYEDKFNQKNINKNLKNYEEVEDENELNKIDFGHS